MRYAHDVRPTALIVSTVTMRLIMKRGKQTPRRLGVDQRTCVVLADEPVNHSHQTGSVGEQSPAGLAVV